MSLKRLGWFVLLVFSIFVWTVILIDIVYWIFY